MEQATTQTQSNTSQGQGQPSQQGQTTPQGQTQPQGQQGSQENRVQAEVGKLPDGGLLNPSQKTDADKNLSAPVESIWGDKQPQWPEGMEGDDWSSIKESNTLKNFVGDDGSLKVPQMLKALVSLDKLRGSEKVAIPKEDATPEEKADFLKKALGFNHDDITTYDLKESELPDNIHGDLKKFLFDSKLPKSIADGVVDKVETIAKAYEKAQDIAMETTIVEGVESLKDKWADAFDSKVALAKKALSEIASDDLMSKITADPHVVNHPVLVELMANIGDMMYRESVVNQLAGGSMAMTKAQMQEKINEYRAGEAYTNPRHPQYRDVNKKVEELYEKLYS